jgi:hypothetical protein
MGTLNDVVVGNAFLRATIARFGRYAKPDRGQRRAGVGPAGLGDKAGFWAEALTLAPPELGLLRKNRQ